VHLRHFRRAPAAATTALFRPCDLDVGRLVDGACAGPANSLISEERDYIIFFRGVSLRSTVPLLT
jgi:hypothetical protein